MTHLRLEFLGRMQVIVSEQPIVTFPYEKVKALFAYLATESNYPHRRDTLAAMFWADQCESKARSNLRKALSVLRHLLGDGIHSPLFLTTRNTIQLSFDNTHHTLDIARFTQLLERHPQPSKQFDAVRPEHISDLEQAIGLYRGPFLDRMQLPCSESFESWLMLNREHFHQLVVDACITLIAYYEHQQDEQKVKQYTEKQLQLEPWNEIAHQRLMQLLVRQGQRTAALRQYDRCCKVLEQQLATEPEPATIALGEAIRSGSFPNSMQANANALRLSSKPVVLNSPARELTCVKSNPLPASATSLVSRKQNALRTSCFKRPTYS